MGILDRWFRREGDGGSGAVPGPGYRHPGFGGSTSFHLWWGPLGRAPIVEVEATLEVLVDPAVRPTYFWALQATFADAQRTYGAAHLGLQSYARFGDRRAANWGGYAEPPASRVLAGTPPVLPGFDDDPNTRAYPWAPGVPYRLRIFRGVDGWAGEVTDLVSGQAVVLRELLAAGDRLQSPVVWSEVFAPCESPSASVRWSDLVARTSDGHEVRPDRVRLTLPNGRSCPNINVSVDAVGVVQSTGVVRTARDGGVIALPQR